MNTYITLACVLTVAGLSHGSAIDFSGLGLGLGSPLVGTHVISAPILAPAAISTANMVKAAPIPVIRTIAAPVITAPVIKTISPIGLGGISPLGYGLGGVGLSSLGLSPLGVKSVVVPSTLGLGGWGKY